MLLDAIGAGLIFLFNVVLWLLVLPRRPVSSVARSYFFWSFFIALWSVGYGITLGGFFSYGTTLLWNKFCQSMATLVAPFFFRLACAIAEDKKSEHRFYRWYLGFGAVNALLLFITPYYVRGLWSFGPYPYQPLGGPIYILFTAFFFACTTHGFLVLFRHYSLARGLKKSQLRIFIWGTAISYLGGATLFLQGFHIPFPTTGVYLVLAYTVLTAFAIHKYHFMDIPVLVKRSVVFTGLFAMVMAVVMGGTVFLEGLLSRYFKMADVAASSLCVTLAVLLYDPTRHLLLKWTEKYFFPSKARIRGMLHRLSSEFVTILDMRDLVTKILDALEHVVGLEAATVLVKSPDVDSLERAGSFGIQDSLLPTKAMHDYFQMRVQEGLHFEGGEEITRLPKSAQDELAAFRAAAVFPLRNYEGLIGLLILGAKKSDPPFDREELDDFSLFAGAMAIALSNARLCDALKQKQVELAQNAKVKALGTMVSSINHDLRNPLYIIHGLAEGFLEREKEMPEGDPVQTLQKASENLQKILKQTTRALDIVRQYSRFAKFGIDRRPEVEKIDLRNAIESVSVYLGHEITNGKIKLEVDIPDSFSVLRADSRQFEEILFNLLTNACQAMKEGGMLRIAAKAMGGSIQIDIQDEGPGIPPAQLDKIFEPFYTTKTEGTGLGLYIVKQLVERNGGKISVRSGQGQGTTFTLEFPAAARAA